MKQSVKTSCQTENETVEEVEPNGDKAQKLVERTNAELESMAEASQPGFNPEQITDMIHYSIGNVLQSSKPRIICTVVDETHGQEVKNTEKDDSEEEIRL